MTLPLPPIAAAVVLFLYIIHTGAPLCTDALARNARCHAKRGRTGSRLKKQPSPPAWRRLSANTNAASSVQLLATTGSSSSSSFAATTTNNVAPYSSSSQRTALSMPVDELSLALGGRGRARIAWDCYLEGVDPQFLFHSSLSSHSLGDTANAAAASSSSIIISSSSSSSSSIPEEYQNPEQLKNQILPTPRRTQPLGASALELLADLHAHCTNGKIENGLATLVHASSSSDGTTKLLLRLVDGLEVETVLIPFWNNDNDNHSNGGRTTVCISSQVGCKQACQFCATGKMGMVRNLSSDEILVQLFFAKKIVRAGGAATRASDAPYDIDEYQAPATTTTKAGPMPRLPKISNVVFMGMGEPSDNARAVRHAIDIMTQNELFQLSANRVTVSTVAPTPQSFMEFDDAQCVLAWSVHAARDELRRRLVPTTRYTVSELRDGLVRALRNRRLRTCMIEVALMDGANDSTREAEEMAELISFISDSVPGSKVMCNLIPYNEIGAAGSTTTTMGSFCRPSMAKVLAYQRRLQAAGIRVHVRGTRGDDESAACGQLVTGRKEKKKPVMKVV